MSQLPFSSDNGFITEASVDATVFNAVTSNVAVGTARAVATKFGATFNITSAAGANDGTDGVNINITAGDANESNGTPAVGGGVFIDGGAGTTPGDINIGTLGSSNISMGAPGRSINVNTDILSGTSVNAPVFTNQGSNTIVRANTESWTFDITGNLNLPGNTFAVNYANGTPVTFGGGGTPTQIVNGTSDISINTANGNISGNIDGVKALSVLNGTGGGGGVSVGWFAGSQTPGEAAVAIGAGAGAWSQGASSIAIGVNAGVGSIFGNKLGARSIAIGEGALNGGSPANTISLRATGDFQAYPENSGFYVAPVRNDTGNTTNAVYYNTTTQEVTYGPAGGGGGGVTQIVAGTGITVDPAGGTGAVTVNYAGATYTNNDVQSFLNGTGPGGALFEGPLLVAGGTPVISGAAFGFPVNIANYAEVVADNGDVSGTLAIEPAEGTIQRYTLTGNITINGFATAVAGTNVTLVLTQDATGGRTLTSSMKFLGGVKTLSTAANAIDVLSVFYDGVDYLATLGKGYA